MSKNRKIQLNKRLLVIVAVSLVVLLMTSVTAYAWFTNRRRLDTITKINAPSTLVIGAGAKEDAVNIDLGRIDADADKKKKDVVFCVYSDESVQNYKLQLAHTTNIDFTYTIYTASVSDADPGGDRVEYIDAGNKAYYYTKTTPAVPITGGYLNKTDKIANETLHDNSYGKYTNVQKNAEPLYWQSTEITDHFTDGSGFVDYYILEVSWGEDVKNDKETDMVYITAGVV